eukprot:2497654-Ditylum_brightwellii.AAC.1
MPPKGYHRFVGMCQLDTLYKCDKIETDAFNVICSQKNPHVEVRDMSMMDFPASLVNIIVAGNFLLAMQHVLLE